MAEFPQHLRQKIAANDVALARLHEQASEWYESQAHYELAIRHALAAQSWTRAAYLIDALADDLLARAEVDELQSWLTRLPEADLRTWPRLIILQAYLYLLAGDLQQTAGMLEAVAGQLSDPTQRAGLHLPASETGHSGLAEVHGHLAAVKARLALESDQVELALELARLAMQQLPLSRPLWRGLAAFSAGDALVRSDALEAAGAFFAQVVAEALQVGSPVFGLRAGLRQFDCLWNLGRLKEAHRLCQALLAMLLEQAVEDQPLAARLYARWAELLAESGSREEALLAAAQALRLAGTEAVARLDADLALARVYLARREFEPARRTLAALPETAKSKPQAVTELRIAIELAAGRLVNAAAIFSDLGLDPVGISPDEPTGLRRLAAQLLLNQGRARQALVQLEAIHREELRRGYEQAGVETLVLLALTYQTLEDEQACLDALSQALFLAAPQGWVQPFLHYGRGMARLLYQAAAQDIQPEFIGQLLEIVNDD